MVALAVRCKWFLILIKTHNNERMAYNPYMATGSMLQGASPLLQGSTPVLQGSQNTVQQPKAATPAPAYGAPGATTPATKAKQQYVNDLSARFGLTNGTVYDKTTGSGFSNPQDFFKAAGVNSFDNLKFDTGYSPSPTTAPAAGPGTAAPTTTSPLAQFNANVPATQAPDPMAAFKDAYTKYIGSLGQTDAVSKARQNYLDYVTNAQLGVNNIAGQGRGIPLQLVRGQQEKLAGQAEIVAKRLQGDVELAQNEQKALQDQAKAGLDFQTTLLGNQQKTASDARAFALENNITTPFFTVGGTVYRTSDLQPFGSQAEAFGAGVARDYSNAPAIRKPTTPIALGEGSTLFDPATGRPIFTNPKSNSSNVFGQFDLTSGQQTLLNGIINKYNASPLVAAADRTIVLKNTVDAIRKDPSNGTLQLNLVYSYIQALDTYQSAVREGELGLVNSIDSRVGQLQGEIQKIQNGQVVRPEVAKQIADAATQIIDTINQGAKQKAQSFRSQANIFGLGQVWDAYTGGFNPSYDSGGGDINNDPLGLGFNTVGKPQASTGSAQSIANAIKQVESGGNYNAKGASGEFGAYQFMPSTWKSWAQTYLGNANAPMTQQNQDTVALKHIQSLLDKGYNAQEIALIWNGGSPTIKSGTNKYGVKYDTGAYARKVLAALS